MDGAGTMMTLVGTLVGGVALSSVTSDVAGVVSMVGMLSAAVVTFGLTSARRLLDKGFR
jgi:hypothetical protein